MQPLRSEHPPPRSYEHSVALTSPRAHELYEIKFLREGRMKLTFPHNNTFFFFFITKKKEKRKFVLITFIVTYFLQFQHRMDAEILFNEPKKFYLFSDSAVTSGLATTDGDEDS